MHRTRKQHRQRRIITPRHPRRRRQRLPHPIIQTVRASCRRRPRSQLLPRHRRRRAHHLSNATQKKSAFTKNLSPCVRESCLFVCLGKTATHRRPLINILQSQSRTSPAIDLSGPGNSLLVNSHSDVDRNSRRDQFGRGASRTVVRKGRCSVSEESGGDDDWGRGFSWGGND